MEFREPYLHPSCVPFGSDDDDGAGHLFNQYY